MKFTCRGMFIVGCAPVVMMSVLVLLDLSLVAKTNTILHGNSMIAAVFTGKIGTGKAHLVASVLEERGKIVAVLLKGKAVRLPTVLMKEHGTKTAVEFSPGGLRLIKRNRRVYVFQVVSSPRLSLSRHVFCSSNLLRLTTPTHTAALLSKSSPSRFNHLLSQLSTPHFKPLSSCFCFFFVSSCLDRA
jgi:hypothetical protein